MFEVQSDGTSVLLTWTTPDPLGDTTGYTISYTGGGSSGSVNVAGGSTDSFSLTGLDSGETYTISLVGRSRHIPSAAITAQIVPSEAEIALDVFPRVKFFGFSPSSWAGVGVSELHNSHLHLPLLECVQWEGGQLGGRLETH